jgi:hypothetical protein
MEVNEIENNKNANKPPPIVVSHVKPEEGYDLLESKS